MSEGATALFGANGSGKTSFLEAIHLLGMGRSFRTRYAKSIIQHSHATCRVVGRIRRGARSQSVGVEKDRDAGLRARIGGENVSSLSELAQALPIVLLDTDSMSLLTGAPEGRRRLLDGTLFHVEQGFLTFGGGMPMPSDSEMAGCAMVYLTPTAHGDINWLRPVNC